MSTTTARHQRPVLARGAISAVRFAQRGLDWKAMIVIGILVAAAIIVPLSVNSPDSPFHLSTSFTILMGRYLCFALLALSVGLIWGYGGILSLGHGAFFALGGYAMGMYLMRQIGSRGVYGNPELPDFMVFLQYTELPWFWQGFDQFWFAAIWIFLAPGLLAFLFGWFAFRSRVTGVYLSIITQALTYALWLAFFRNDMGFGGNNGLTDFKDILGANVQAPTTRAWLFAASALALALGYWICRAVVASKYGKVLVAVRDAESRTRFFGYRPDRYKLFVFTLSACMAGVAGALYVPQTGIINPSEFSPLKSIEAVVWVAVGGRGTLVGPIIGGISVNAIKSYFTGGSSLVHWMIAIVPLLGIVGLAIARLKDGIRRTPLIGAAIGAAVAALVFVIMAIWPADPVPRSFAFGEAGPGTTETVAFFDRLAADGVPGAASALSEYSAGNREPALRMIDDAVAQFNFESALHNWAIAVAVIAMLVWLVNASPMAAAAALGALVVALLRNYSLEVQLSPYWTFVLGGLFVAVTMFLPRGIVGTITYGWNAWRARRESIKAQAGMDADLTDPEPRKLEPDGPPEPEAAPPPGAVLPSQMGKAATEGAR